MMMAWHCTPHFLFFFRKEKEKTGRARSKREKEVYGEATGARLNDQRSWNDFPRAIGFGGGLFFNEWTSFSFRCRYPGAGGKPPEDGGQQSAAPHPARTEKEVR